jgi:hypothetical protein
MKLCMKMQGFIYTMWKLGFADMSEIDDEYLVRKAIEDLKGTTAAWSDWEV